LLPKYINWISSGVFLHAFTYTEVCKGLNKHTFEDAYKELI